MTKTCACASEETPTRKLDGDLMWWPFGKQKNEKKNEEPSEDELWEQEEELAILEEEEENT